MVRTGKGRLFVVDGGGKLVLGDEPSLAKGFPLLSNLAVPWEIDCGSLCMQRFQTAIETASKDVVGKAEGSADLGQQSLDTYDGSRGTVSVQELQVPGEARPFRTVFFTEDAPFVYSPVVVAAMTGWVRLARHDRPCWLAARLARPRRGSASRSSRRPSRHVTSRNFVKISAKCCSFSAVSAPIFASKCAFVSIF